MNKYLRIFYYRKLLNRHYIYRVGLITLYILLVTLILPKSYKLEFQYQVGQVWKSPTVYAPFDFSIYKTPDSLERERVKVASEVYPIFRLDSTRVDSTIRSINTELTTFREQLIIYTTSQERDDSIRAQQIEEVFFLQRYAIIPKEFTRDSAQQYSLWLGKVKRHAKRVLDSLYEKGYIEDESHSHNFISLREDDVNEVITPKKKFLFPNEVVNYIDLQIAYLRLRPRNAKVLKKIIADNIRPSHIYDEILTQAEIERRTRKVFPVYGKIKGGEAIIESGRVVTKDKDAIIQSLIREQENRFGEKNNTGIFLGQLIMVFLITLVFLVYLRINRTRIYFNVAQLTMVLLIMFMTVGAMVLAVKLTDIISSAFYLSYIYLVPACVVPILISNFYDHRTGFMANLVVALYGGITIQQGLEFLFIQIVTGTIAVYWLRRLRKREVFFYTLGYIWLTYSIAYISFALYSKGSLSPVFYGNLLLFVFNTALTIIAYPLIYLFERIFKVTSDLTYLELLDTNHPLLQKLARKAPGTFQHSLQVANIAEATIQVIGGNALLTHVGALYHDIGKMKQPPYFIENAPEQENPHNKIDHKESAKIIIGHIQHGINLAQEYNLPTEIENFILTHHGNTRVEYFYRKHKETQPDCNEQDFRYPGPRPFSKEMAVLMLSDSIEAASKSIKQPTPEKLQKLVNGIIDHKINDNQLENSNLTFKDISVIREVIFKQLRSIYHSRIEYPKETTKV